MHEKMNLLILSCGTRNKIVNYFKSELKGIGKIIVTDSSEMAPALYEADKHYIVPRIEDEKYLKTILDICKENNIKGVMSLIDPEISLLAKNKEKFLEVGTTPLISDYEVVETCFDKYKMFNFLVKNNFNTMKSYIDKGLFYKDLALKKIEFPVFVKPIKGSASINISKVNSKEEIELLFSRFDNLMIQEFIDGIEYGVDVYIDWLANKPVEIFIKEKIKMRAGETDKAKAIKDDNIFDLVKDFTTIAGYKGVIDIDIFMKNDKYYISEVNPRFGGGYPHAHESGSNLIKLIINNLRGITNPVTIGDYKEGTLMMKFNEILMLDNNLLRMIEE